MSQTPTQRHDPNVALQKLRTRIAKGGRPALEHLVDDEMAAANELISKGEAEIVCTGCHLYLTATLD